jgi:hypothetical protein
LIEKDGNVYTVKVETTWRSIIKSIEVRAARIRWITVSAFATVATAQRTK